MKPQRIASLLASATEILYGLGLGEKVVAVSHECDFPSEVAGKPRVTYTYIAASASSIEIDRDVTQRVAAGKPIYNIDAERLASLRPDLIVTQAQCEVCAVSHDDVLRAVQGHDALKNTVVAALSATTLDEIFEDIIRVGDAAACPAEAQAYVTDLRKRVEVVRAKVASAAARHRPRVVCLEWIEPVMVAANWMPELIDLAGGQSELASPGARSDYTDWDDVVAFDPEVVVVMPCGFDLARTLDEARDLPKLRNWSKLTAVGAERVYAVDGNAYFNRSGPRIIDSLEILAELIHPTVFGGAARSRVGIAAKL
ncbi:MAG: cobalamin-binding protein [Planctomycetes bacterium]|nr:cobalamin-binding protein [Planctomycetota bacterium]